MAHADRGLNDHRTKVRDALTCLLTETVTDDKHKEILRRVLGSDTTFDKPIAFSDISIAFSDSVNSRALEHEATMLDVYSKMTRDAFSSQLQTVLTDYYEDIKGIVCASGCTKSKVVKRKFEDHDDIPADAPAPAPAPAPAADNAADNAADPPPTSPTDGGASSAGGEEPAPPATSPAGKVGRGAKAGGAGKKGGKPQG